MKKLNILISQNCYTRFYFHKVHQHHLYQELIIDYACFSLTGLLCPSVFYMFWVSFPPLLYTAKLSLSMLSFGWFIKLHKYLFYYFFYYLFLLLLLLATKVVSTIIKPTWLSDSWRNLSDALKKPTIANIDKKLLYCGFYVICISYCI